MCGIKRFEDTNRGMRCLPQDQMSNLPVCFKEQYQNRSIEVLKNNIRIEVFRGEYHQDSKFSLHQLKILNGLSLRPQ